MGALIGEAVMEVEATPLAGLLVIKPEAFGDSRGFFLETYSKPRYQEAGITTEFIQANHSRSARGVLRGLHYQKSPGQPKLVSVARGSVFDVAVDIRPNSSTFGQHFSIELSDENHFQLYIPIGFAHGFCVTSDVADFTYLVGSLYDGTHEAGVAYDDPDIGIPWPTTQPILSERDRNNPKLQDIDYEGVTWKSS